MTMRDLTGHGLIERPDRSELKNQTRGAMERYCSAIGSRGLRAPQALPVQRMESVTVGVCVRRWAVSNVAAMGAAPWGVGRA